MSFPKYNRSLVDVSFVDLANYANNLNDTDISLRQCVDDMNGQGDGTSTNIAIGSQKGHHKEENYGEGGGAATRKGQCNISLNFNSPFTLITSPSTYQGFTNEGVIPTVDPFGNAVTPESGDTRLEPLSVNELTSVRYWMWAEEDSLQGTSTTPANTKSDRLLLSELVSSTQVGEEFSVNWDLGGGGGSLNQESGYTNTTISQDDIWGVPEGFGFSRFSLEHGYTGSGQYYVWVGIGYKVGYTDSPGWDSAQTTTHGAWYGPFTRGSGSTFLNYAPTYLSNLSSITGFDYISGLEDKYTPDTVASGAANYANFGIESFITALAYV